MMRRNGSFIILVLALLLANACSENSPDEAGRASFRFVVVGDSRGESDEIPFNSQVLSRLGTAIRGESGVAFVLYPGDLVAGSGSLAGLARQLAAWKTNFADPLSAVGIPVYPVRGNHDQWGGGTRDELMEVWQTNIGRMNPQNGPPGEAGASWGFRHGEALFVGIDLYGQTNGSRMDTNWLAGVLVRTNRQVVFAMAHEPAWSLGDPCHADGLASTMSLAGRNGLIERLGAAGGRVWFCAHDHTFNHARIDTGTGIWHQFVVGTAGAPFYPWTEASGYREAGVDCVAGVTAHGYLVVDVLSDRIRTVFRVLGEEGAISDGAVSEIPMD